jgi:DNA gyrase/topoisomerase IV subunit B
MPAEYKTRDGVTMIEGLEAVRRRPEVYIGAEPNERSASTRLLELVVSGLAKDTPKPSEIRITVCNNAVVVAVDGKPFPVEPYTKGTTDLPHPALYAFFMTLVAGGEGLGRTLAFGGVLNALSERLVVSTMHGDLRYRAVFSRGNIVMMLSKNRYATPLGTTWLTYRRDDRKVIGPALTVVEAQAVAQRVMQSTGVRVNVYDRINDEPDWY